MYSSKHYQLRNLIEQLIAARIRQFQTLTLIPHLYILSKESVLSFSRHYTNLFCHCPWSGSDILFCLQNYRYKLNNTFWSTHDVKLRSHFTICDPVIVFPKHVIRPNTQRFYLTTYDKTNNSTVINIYYSLYTIVLSNCIHNNSTWLVSNDSSSLSYPPKHSHCWI